MKKAFFIPLLLFALSGMAQNNPIFSGGQNDGWNRAQYQQTVNNIYVGGEGDGWSRGAYQQTVTNIFNGGSGDGWNYRAHQQNVKNIYNGGDGDGWSFNAYLPALNNIYVGGSGDGWNFNTYLPSLNNIFPGGVGDGWASVYRPLNVLPVTFLNFTAEKQDKISVLKWTTLNEINTASFEIERSNDAVHFSGIVTIAASGNTTTQRQYSFNDNSPAKGYNYYRLKQVDRNGAFVYTPTRLLIFDGATVQPIRVYPVPATAFITVELPVATRNENVVINLINSVGANVLQLRLAPRADDKRTINLMQLPSGVYTIQVSSASQVSATQIVKQ